jgi:hypothetical protein
MELEAVTQDLEIGEVGGIQVKPKEKLTSPPSSLPIMCHFDGGPPGAAIVSPSPGVSCERGAPTRSRVLASCVIRRGCQSVAARSSREAFAVGIPAGGLGDGRARLLRARRMPMASSARLRPTMPAIVKTPVVL